MKIYSKIIFDNNKITKENLSEVRKKLRIQWYRCQIDKDVLRELTRKNDVKAWFQAGGHLSLFV